MISVELAGRKQEVDFSEIEVGRFFLYDWGEGNGVELWQKRTDSSSVENVIRYTEDDIDATYSFGEGDRVVPVNNMTITVEG